MTFNFDINIVRRALKEDNPSGDITSNILIDRKNRTTADIICKENAVVCGLEVVRRVFKQLDSSVKFRLLVKDGGQVKKNMVCARLTGPTRSILTGERVALNFLSLLSGIATTTRRYVDQVKPCRAAVLDTRKTIPGLRELSKWAVRCGGGKNHRFHLSEMVMVKDNHRFASGKARGLGEAIRLLKNKTRKKIEVEVDTLPEFKEALAAGPDIILLDNMTTRQMKEAVKIRNKSRQRCLLEASGGIMLRNIRAVARTGVDRISVGALTHSPKGIDFSMEFKDTIKSSK